MHCTTYGDSGSGKQHDGLAVMVIISRGRADPPTTCTCASCASHLQAGLTTADRIVTVSAGYAEEIRTYLGGWGMEGILSSRAFVLNGVVNGIDTE